MGKAGYTLLDQKRSEDIFEELKIQEIVRFVQNCWADWKQQVRTIQKNRIRKRIAYRSREKICLGWPLKS
jgi:hypothetical protein